MSQQTERLLKVVDLLQENKTISSDAELCRILAYSPQSFNQIRKRKRNVTVDFIAIFCHEFKASPGYILLGVEPKFTFIDIIKKEITSSTGREHDIHSFLNEELKNSAYLKVLLGLRHWYQRINFLAQTVKSLETVNTEQLNEIKTLRKLISDNLINNKSLEHI